MKTLIKAVAIASFMFAMASCGNAPKYNLTDGEWMMISWKNDNGEEMMLTQNRPTMNFTDSARVYGNAGCNQFMGRYEVSGENIKIDLGGMTLKMCMDMEVENRMVAQMPNVVSFRIDGNQLMLYNGDKKELFRYDNTVAEEGNTIE